MPVIIEPVDAPARDAAKPTLTSRLIWFAGLSLGGVLATAIVAYGLHILLFLR